MQTLCGKSRPAFSCMKALLLLLFAGSFALPTAAQTKPVLFPKLSKTLDSLAYVDEWPQQQIFQQKPDSAGRDLVQVEEDNFARHQPVLERIVRQYGYPGFKQVGEKSSNNFWLLVQHADAHPDFQRQVLRLMLPEVKRKNANPVNYAYLTDRVAVNSGQPQEYGTQVELISIGHLRPRNLRDPANVNKRRAAIRMGTLEAYLELSNTLNLEMNKSKAPTN